MTAALGVIARWLTFAAVLSAVGAIAFRFVVARRVGVSDAACARAERSAASVGVTAGIAVVPAALLRLVVQTAQMRFPDDSWLAIGGRLVASTAWGTIWMVQLVAAMLLVPAFYAARRGGLWRWVTAAVLTLALSITPTLASHAMSSGGPKIVTAGADWIHVLAAGTWIGTLSVMCVALRARDPGDTIGSSMMQWLAAFSPLALTGAAFVAASGLVSSLFRLRGFGALIHTQYGKTLLVKLAAVAIVVLIGWINWKRNTPAVVSSGASPIRAGMRAELIAAAVVLIVTAILVSTSPPMDAMQMP
ncbi:MAG TPA: CopD family protein [Gemmatimonadaceae bacterium]|jgi:putative copper export protein|nr:CopD family protein [Gemmatimonadaceae bacterium]